MIPTILNGLLKLDNILYTLISRLSVQVEHGTHPKHRILNYHQFFLNHIQKNDIVLDIGCGNGTLANKLSEKASKVIGIDINAKQIQRAMLCNSHPNLKFIVGDATQIDLDIHADAIVLSNVLEHIENRVEFLHKLQRWSSRLLLRVPMIDRHWLVYYKKERGIYHFLDRTHYIEYTLNSFIQELRLAGIRMGSYSIQFGEIWAVGKYDVQR